MSAYPLFIVTYDLGERWDDQTKKKPFHWAFFLKTSGPPVPRVRDSHSNFVGCLVRSIILERKE
jgi:hypothetical protein